jgi:hypothetical protein
MSDNPPSPNPSSAKHQSKGTPPISFNQVLKAEREQINASRKARGVKTSKPTEDTIIGLAFSGGGIRSATINLGILQALAEHKLVRKFDYLSTVSGGGYVGSWLAGLAHRFPPKTDPPEFAPIEASLIPGKYETGKPAEPYFLKWLRLYSNYLTPRKGLFSGDTWAAVATWLRNVILNQLVLAFLFLAVFLLPHALVLFQLDSLAPHPIRTFAAGVAILFGASLAMAGNVVTRSPPAEILQTLWKRIQLTVMVMLPLLAASFLLNSSLWWWTELRTSNPWWWVAGGAVYYFLVWTIAVLSHRQKSPLTNVLALALSSLVAGAVGGLLLKEYSDLVALFAFCDGNAWLVAIFGTAAVLGLLLLTAVLHLGLLGRGCMDVVREWWARLGGFLMLAALGWLVLASMAAFGPLLMRVAFGRVHLRKGISALVAWMLSNWAGLAAAKSPKTGRSIKSQQAQKDALENPHWTTKLGGLLKSPKLLDVVARVAPYIFAVGLFLLLATAVQIGTGMVFDPGSTTVLWDFHHNGDVLCCTPAAPDSTSPLDWDTICSTYWVVLSAGSWWYLFLATMVSAGLSLLLSWRVDVNDFSMHHFYRNRLVRCYLGASNPERFPQPFTGFDPKDDFALEELTGDYPGPYPLINAALNITSGEELGFDKRRAKSFVFAPLYSGYDFDAKPSGDSIFARENAYSPAYCLTREGRSEASASKFGVPNGITVGTAMAISGAAASPNMGYHTSAVTALFMTLFDVRLGWWMANPYKADKWPTPGPALGLGYLFSELVAQSDQKKSYVYLSDGGHFENLGVYELLKRRCRVIVACDADCDFHYHFEDLLALIEKARADFGIHIVINFEQIKPGPGSNRNNVNYAVGTIHYSPDDPKDCGTLIYIKAGLPLETDASRKTGELPADVWHYSEQNPSFPHQSTGDQWFDEVQFESYRALGEYIGTMAAGDIAEEIGQVL